MNNDFVVVPHLVKVIKTRRGMENYPHYEEEVLFCVCGHPDFNHKGFLGKCLNDDKEKRCDCKRFRYSHTENIRMCACKSCTR